MRPYSIFAFAALTAGSVAADENLIQNGGFEDPPVVGRTSEAGKVMPVNASGETSWEKIVAEDTSEGGRVVIGVTNEIARTGKQSLFLDYQKVTASEREALLKTKPIPVQFGKMYRVSIWGRIDRDRPLALDERHPQLSLQIHFFGLDGETEVAEAITGLTFIPGIAVPGGPRHLMFVSGKWKETWAEFVVPDRCAFVRVLWFLTTGESPGETDGIIYWDDASLKEVIPAPEVGTTPPPGEEKPSPAIAPVGEEFKGQ